MNKLLLMQCHKSYSGYIQSEWLLLMWILPLNEMIFLSILARAVFFQLYLTSGAVLVMFLSLEYSLQIARLA